MTAKKGQLIISLDCEGKWGMADHITAHHNLYLTHANLLAAYSSLVALFERYQMPATFAFVMAYVLSEAEAHELSDRFVDIEIGGANWLRHFRDAQLTGNMEGWFCPEALEVVRARPEHEIACHGFCHVPLANDLIGGIDVQRELESCLEVADIKRLELETFVYPRNQLGHFSELAAAGFKGFRNRAPSRWGGRVGRLTSLAAEFNILERADFKAATEGGMVAIPAGHFLNWQRGARRLVPRQVSRMRWRRILQDASVNGGTAHVWLHPHNLIDGPGTLDRLEDILAEAALLRDQGRLTVMTQSQYVQG